jgi:hypothetical protein
VNRVTFTFSGSGGESIENAIVMRGGDGARSTTFLAQYYFLDALFPKGRFGQEKTEEVGNRQYHYFATTTHDGRESLVVFDATEVLVAPISANKSSRLRNDVVIEDHTDLREKTPDYVYLCFSGWPPLGPNSLHLIGDKLFYDPRNGEGERCCDVSSEQWRDIAQASHRCGIWLFPSDMSDPDIIDGLLFDLKIKVGSEMHQSHGQLSEYPSIRERLLGFHRTLQELTGWRPAA